jgi:2-oxoglutarate/2-oxoacid ferredoxin oxidoreductase subunit alpha
MSTDYNLMVAGEAGQGVQSTGLLLAKVFVRNGYHVFADQDYESRISGGHNFFRIRVRDSHVGAIVKPINILIAFNKASIDLHFNDLVPDGVVIYDGDTITDIPENRALLKVPLSKLAEEKSGDKLMTNTVALGAAMAIIGFDPEVLNTVIVERFKIGKMAESNLAAVKAGYEYAQSVYKGSFHKLEKLPFIKKMLLNGNEALSLGAIAAGCKFMAAYPMTPASSIMEYLAAKSSDFGLVMVHAEDEIAAMNMVIGAAYAGVRAMTATSGSGFCLMVEGLGLAGMTETPIVVVDGQRPGPAVGLPTRTEQGDLQFVLYAHHGDFPRAVLAPANAENAFWLTVKAFNWADKYQLPVIILTDQHLASSYYTIDPFDISGVTVDRGLLHKEDSQPSEYKRHKITDSGISPRAFPGMGKALVVTDSDEHNEEGHLIEDAQLRTEQMQKRLRKLTSLKQEVSAPRRDGPQKTDTLLVGWGSTYEAIHETMEILRNNGSEVSVLHLEELWPFPAEAVADALNTANRSYVIENNATGQLAHLIKAETGRDVSGRILKFDGRPFTPSYIAEAVRKEMR